MADKTSIEWTESSWNPIIATMNGVRGWHCVHASEGCRHCYAETLNKRLGTGIDYAAQHTKLVNIDLAPPGGQSSLDWPIRAKKPRRIFVCSMTDLFGDWVPDEMIDHVFAVMADAKHHTFQVLTKRAERMLAWSRSRQGKQFGARGARLGLEGFKHVWLGVSCEDQKTADQRIPLLLQTPAAVRWVSYEPAIGPINFRTIASVPDPPYGFRSTNVLAEGTGLHWIVVGGESGPGTRPFDLAWARETVQDCSRSNVKCFVKQLGANPYADRGELWRIGPRGEQPIIRDKKGGNMDEWPTDLRVRQWPGLEA